MKNKHPEKCVNCGREIYRGSLFYNQFLLCPTCDVKKGEIIFDLKARLKRCRRDIVKLVEQEKGKDG